MSDTKKPFYITIRVIDGLAGIERHNLPDGIYALSIRADAEDPGKIDAQDLALAYDREVLV